MVRTRVPLVPREWNRVLVPHVYVLESERRVLNPPAGRRADQRRGDIAQGSGNTPGLAAEAYAAVKAAKYADQDNFIPFILETGGRVNKAGTKRPATGLIL